MAQKKLPSLVAVRHIQVVQLSQKLHTLGFKQLLIASVFNMLD